MPQIKETDLRIFFFYDDLACRNVFPEAFWLSLQKGKLNMVTDEQTDEKLKIIRNIIPFS